MADAVTRMDEIKRKVRKLKKLEVRIRFNGINDSGRDLIWGHFFELRETNDSRAKYSLRMLASMNQEEYENVINEYLSFVYYELYKKNGISSEEGIYDPGILSRLDLPINADENNIKKRFRALAKKYHPDAGGDAAMFIELRENYNKLLGKQKW